MDLYKFEDPILEQKMSDLLQMLNVILRVYGSWRQKINIPKFSRYVLKAHLLLHEVFPFMKDNGMFDFL